jgi:hypothetical protein
MAAGSNDRSRLLTAGGILSIVAGAFEVIGGAIMMGLTIAHRELFRLVGHGVWGGTPAILFGPFGFVDLILLIIVGVPIFALGIVAIVGGVSAIRRKRFGLSLAGAICALLLMPLGILAIIFVLLSKREFGAERKENGI